MSTTIDTPRHPTGCLPWLSNAYEALLDQDTLDLLEPADIPLRQQTADRSAPYPSPLKQADLLQALAVTKAPTATMVAVRSRVTPQVAIGQARISPTQPAPPPYVDRYGLYGYKVHPTTIYDLAGGPFEQRLAYGARLWYATTGQTLPYCTWQCIPNPEAVYQYTRGRLEAPDPQIRKLCAARLQTIQAAAAPETYLEHSLVVHVASTHLAPEVEACIPSDALPLDEPEQQTPQTIEEHVAGIPAAHLPPDPAKATTMRALLLELGAAFSLYKFDIGTVDPVKYGYFEIDTGEEAPYWEPQRRLSFQERKQLLDRIAEYDAAGVTEVGSGPWASNPIFVPKKDGDVRLCIDLRGLNHKTVKDRHPLPRVEDLLADVRGAKYFSTLDLKSAYNACLIRPEDRHKTNFYSGIGLRQHARLAMGLANAPSFFQRLMERLVADMVHPETGKPFAKAYLDDVIIFSNTWQEHLLHVRMVVQCLQAAGLKLSASKCYWGQRAVLYLGHIVNGAGTRPNPKLCQGVQEFPVPTSIKQVQAFLGICNYFRNYIPKFADLAAPLHRLTHKDGSNHISSRWGPPEQAAFDALKLALVSPPCLRQPDFTKTFYLHTDASAVALGAVLTQINEVGEHQPIGFASRLLRGPEPRYSATESECLAVIWAVEHFRHYLHGHHFHLYTDHHALQYLLGGRAAKSTNRKHHRWIAELQGYDFDVEHRAGTDNIVPDALSRCHTAELTGDQLQLQYSLAGPTVSSLVATVGSTFTGTVHHRPSSFFSSSVPEGTPHITLLAAYLVAVHTTENPALPTVQAATLAARCSLPVVPVYGHSHHIYQAITDLTAATALLVPDLRMAAWNTDHRRWLGLLPDLRIMQTITTPSAPARPWLLVCRTGIHRLPQSASLPHMPRVPAVPLPAHTPLHLLELCGGIAVFLEACLRRGCCVQRYTYVDSDPIARAACHHRLGLLHAQYPHQFPATATRQWATALPQDVHQVTEHNLSALGPVHLIAAGPPCQSFSSAGLGHGVRASCGQVLPQVLRIITALYRKQPSGLTYIVENVPGALRFPEVRQALGEPVLIDAVQYGSAAHRRTCFWSNAAPPRVTQDRLYHLRVLPPLTLRDLLQQALPLHQYFPYAHSPQYFPKFMRRHGSYAHRLQRDGHPGPGMVQTVSGQALELPADGRELAMGFYRGATAAPALHDQQRRQLLGNCIDVNLATAYIGAIMDPPAAEPLAVPLAARARSAALPRMCATAAEHLRAVATAPCSVCGDAAGEDNMVFCDGCDRLFHLRCLLPPQSTVPSGPFFCPTCDPDGCMHIHELHRANTPLHYHPRDPYQNGLLLFYLEHADFPLLEPPTTPQQRQAVRRLANRYRRHPTQALWLQYRGKDHLPWRTIPPVEYRLDIIRVHHDAAGHPGVQHTHRLISTCFTWIGIAADVYQYWRSCHACQLHHPIHAPLDPPRQFDMATPFQHVLMDSCGPFYLPWQYTEPWEPPPSGPPPPSAGPPKAWILIMVDYFTKVAEFAVLRDRTALSVAQAAYDHWLSRYPRPVKWTTDCGTENGGAFTAMLQRLGIPHILTAVFNPTGNSPAERLVRTLKTMLKRLVASHATGWPAVLPQARAAYMRRVHRSTGFSPLELLTGVADPILTPLGQLLPEVALIRLTPSPATLPALHWRSPDEHILPGDAAFLLAATPMPAVSLDQLDKRLQLPFLLPDVSPREYAAHADAHTRHRAQLYLQARQSIEQVQRCNRMRYHTLLQRRSEPLTYQVQPGDYVLVADRAYKGLAPKFIGPFQVVRITAAGNIVLATDTAGTLAPSRQWRVKPGRVYPYRFSHQCSDAAGASPPAILTMTLFDAPATSHDLHVASLPCALNTANAAARQYSHCD